MALSENVQMYLVTIYRITESHGGRARTKDVADMWNVSPSSATEMIRKLADMGYVIHEPYHGVELTEKGAEVGRAITRKRRLVEAFLADVVGMEEPDLTESACELEHVLPAPLEAWMCESLHHPVKSPSGDAIPPGPCCPIPDDADEAPLSHAASE